MSTPLDKRGYMFTESYGPKQHYRLVIGFESLDDLHAAQDFILNREQKQPRMETRSAPVQSQMPAEWREKIAPHRPKLLDDDCNNEVQDLMDRDRG